MKTKKNIVKITGGGSGIGKALALEYASLGNIVCISGRTIDKLRQVKDEAKAFGNNIHIFQEDVTNLEQVKNVYQEISNSIGTPDIIYLNAGHSIHSPIHQFDVNHYRELMEINYMGVVNGLSCYLPEMIKAKSGHILITGSVAGYRGLPTATAYCATKAALNNLTEGLAAEARKYHIKIQLICPGFIKTPMTDKNKFPMPFLTSPQDIANYIIKKSQTNSFEIVYPRLFGFIMKFFRILPNCIVQYLNFLMLKK